MGEIRHGSAVWIGKKIVLLRLGKDGSILEKISVEIVGLSNKGLWGTGFRDWTAHSETGEKFTGSWWQDQADQDFPFRMWDERKDQRGQWRPIEEGSSSRTA